MLDDIINVMHALRGAILVYLTTKESMGKRPKERAIMSDRQRRDFLRIRIYNLQWGNKLVYFYGRRKLGVSTTK